MFKHLVLIVGACLAASAGAFADPARDESRHAIERMRQLPGNTVYEKIAALYEEGRRPTHEELIGSHSGRAYRIEEPNRALGTFLSVTDQHEAIRGPLFAGQLLAVTLYNETAARYDELSDPDLETLRKQIASYLPERSPLTFDGRQAVHVHDTFRSSLRVARGFIVERVARDFSNAPFWYGYFFKRHEPGP